MSFSSRGLEVSSEPVPEEAVAAAQVGPQLGVACAAFAYPISHSGMRCAAHCSEFELVAAINYAEYALLS